MKSFFRIIKFSFQGLARNAWLSVVTITILLLALFSINTLITVQVVSDNAISAIKDKIDISLYFNADAPESEILSLKEDLENNTKIKSVTYISKDEALRSFREKYQNNDPVLSALKELDKNPLSPSLIILPSNIEESKLLINELKVLDNPNIESRDFTDNSMILEKIGNITQRINELGVFIILIFVLTSLLVVYNAIRIAIYTHRQEIEIERLVGASNFFIYMPYIFSSFLYSLISVLIIIGVFFPLLSVIQPYLEVFFTGYNVNILNYFISNFAYLFGLQFLAILFINIIATLIAVRRYAKV